MADPTSNTNNTSNISIRPRECEGGDKDGVFKRSVPTGEVLTAALSKLNNASIIKLMGDLSEAINTCCQDVKPVVYPPVPPVNETWFIEINNTFTNIQTSITNINKMFEQINVVIDNKITNVETHITNVETHITNVDNSIDVKISEYNKTVLNVAITTINEQITKVSNTITTVINNFFGSIDVKMTLTEIINNLTEIKVEIDNVHKTFVTYEGNFTSINEQITKIWAQINVLIENTSTELKVRIDQLEVRITSIENDIKLIKLTLDKLGPDGGGHYNKQEIIDIFLSILQENTYVTQIFNSLKITINNTSKTVVEVLEILARAEYVREVTLIYNDTDITGATYILTDGCVYTFKARYQNLEGNTFKYIFETTWNGIPAVFTSTFRETTKTWTVCKRDVSLVTYEPVSSTNIEFALF